MFNNNQNYISLHIFQYIFQFPPQIRDSGQSSPRFPPQTPQGSLPSSPQPVRRSAPEPQSNLPQSVAQSPQISQPVSQYAPTTPNGQPQSGIQFPSTHSMNQSQPVPLFNQPQSVPPNNQPQSVPPNQPHAVRSQPFLLLNQAPNNHDDRSLPTTPNQVLVESNQRPHSTTCGSSSSLATMAAEGEVIHFFLNYFVEKTDRLKKKLLSLFIFY